MVKGNPYRELPSVDRLLSDARVREVANGGAEAVTEIVRSALEAARAGIAMGVEPPTEEQLVESVLGLADVVFRPSLRPVINATG